jgi:hypothetical protein
MKKNNSTMSANNTCTCSAIQKCDMHRKSRLTQESSSVEKNAQQEQKNVAMHHTMKKEGKNKK